MKWVTGRLLEYCVIDGYKMDVRVVTPVEQSIAFFGKELPTV